MIERYEILLEVQSDQDPLWRSPARGTLMHGLLMTEIKSDTLHDNKSMRPYTQHMQALSAGRYVWTINTLGAAAEPLHAWIESMPQQLHLDHYDLTLAPCEVNKVFSCTYEEFMAKSLDELPPKYVTFELLTPMVFKKSGQSNVWQWPEARLMIQSALTRWNTFAGTEKLDDPQILEDVAAKVQPFSFQVQSQHVSMDGVNFAGTVGKISFVIQNRAEVRQVVNLAGTYAEFCGFGAKTAMGLGAVKYLPSEVSRPGRQRHRRSEEHRLAAG